MKPLTSQKPTTTTETPEVTMRNTRTVQPSVFQAPAVVHPIAAELERASEWLDQHRELLDTISRCVKARPPAVAMA